MTIWPRCTNLRCGFIRKAARSNTKYFLDKSIWYILIIEEIIQLFPEAKLIFLWRSPLAVVSSTMETWYRGIWRIYHHEIQLFQGLANLVAAYQKHADQVYAIRYEAVVLNAEKTWWTCSHQRGSGAKFVKMQEKGSE